MSEYVDLIDSHHAICPYCEHEQYVEGEDYSEDEREELCEECNKFFWLQQEYVVNHCTRPDCAINLKQHDYALKVLTNGRKAYFCKICGDCKLYKEESEEVTDE